MIGDMSPRELFEFAIHRVTCDVAMMKQEELKDHIDEYDEYVKNDEYQERLRERGV